MASLTTARVLVRTYECDVYGHLNNANYLRLMTLADEGEPPQGRLLRAHIEFVRSVGPGDGVTITAASEDDGHGHLTRRYRLTSAGGEIATGRFEYLGAGATDRGTPVPAAPAAPPGAYTVRRPVEWRDVGIDGTVPVAALAALAEDAGIRVVAAHGWPMTRCAEDGFAIVLRSIDVELGRPAGLDDIVRIDTYASGLRRSMITRHYLMSGDVDGAPLARFASLYVWVDLESNRPIRVPEAFVADLTPNIVA